DRADHQADRFALGGLLEAELFQGVQCLGGRVRQGNHHVDAVVLDDEVAQGEGAVLALFADLVRQAAERGVELGSGVGGTPGGQGAALGVGDFRFLSKPGDREGRVGRGAVGAGGGDGRRRGGLGSGGPRGGGLL